MSEETGEMSIRDRIRWWIYAKCFAYCVRMIHPDANPDEFYFLDAVNFVAITREEVREIIEEAPEIAWRFGLEAS